MRTCCPLDCWDVCGLEAEIEQGRVIRLSPDPRHPVARGAACVKSRCLTRLLNHPERLMHPLGKTKRGGFERLSWDAALARWAETLAQAKAEGGPLSVLHYTDSGSQGVLKALDKRFFARFGGSTVPRGSLCNSAGLAAQAYDFGTGCSHEPEDLRNSRLVVLWGRNPLDTNFHVAWLVREARQAGATVVLIDPLRTRSAALADWVLQPRPGTDAALAQAVARELIESGRYDQAFVRERVAGFDAYRTRVRDWTPERAAGVTGVAAEDIRRLADLFAGCYPAAILLGYGPQRYLHGGSTIRAIDALGALSGNVGTAGGGVNYAHRLWHDLKPIDGRELPQEVRHVRRALLGEDLEKLARAGAPVRAAVFAHTNPAGQAPDTARVRAALASVPFKVVIDLFLTDTAAQAELVLPAAAFTEEEDAYKASTTSYLTYGPQLVEPPGECRTEREMYRSLAGLLGMAEAEAELAWPAGKWLAELLEPFGGEAALARLREDGVLRHPRAAAVPFADGRFPTPSGKVELLSEVAARDGQDPVAGVPWPWPESAPGPYAFRLLSPQPRHRLHSIFGNQGGPASEQVARINPEDGRRVGLADGDEALLESAQGTLSVPVRFDAGVAPGLIVIPNGGWDRHGGTVNWLTRALVSDMGDQAAYYETQCNLAKAR
ncbi:MAG: molybdopterin-containing oxidoreductase family protein [Chitinophagales bacterium]